MSRLSAVRVLELGSGLYQEVHGLPAPLISPRRVIADPLRGQRLAAVYMAAPRSEQSAVPAYRAFCRETERQFAFLTRRVTRGGLGIDVVTSQRDPYPDARAMVRDVVENRRLCVFASSASGNEHPLLSDEINDMFRAVHDAFGHASIGRGFDSHGEEAAWYKHSHMYSPFARRAMTTETRGQNSAMIFALVGQEFAEQKAVLLPPEFSDPRSIAYL